VPTKYLKAAKTAIDYCFL